MIMISRLAVTALAVLNAGVATPMAAASRCYRARIAVVSVVAATLREDVARSIGSRGHG